jgi:hypothetical protein
VPSSRLRPHHPVHTLRRLTLSNYFNWMEHVFPALCCWVVVRLFVFAGLFPVLTSGSFPINTHSSSTCLCSCHEPCGTVCLDILNFDVALKTVTVCVWCFLSRTAQADLHPHHVDKVWRQKCSTHALVFSYIKPQRSHRTDKDAL